MTVSYARKMATGSGFGCFWSTLRRWRGSVYKLVWRELIAFLAAYYTINLVYRFCLPEEHKQYIQKLQNYLSINLKYSTTANQSTFEYLRNKAAEESGIIPMSFVLGFYVNLIVKRWWEQYKLLPWPDTLALFISAAIPGNNETGRLMRRSIMRYAVLAYVVTLMRISLRVKRRFPSLQHLVDAGLMTESEKKIFEKMDGKSPMSKYWMPLVWATNIINRARKQEIIATDHIVQTLLMELSDIRRRLGALIGYDTVCVPLVYTQVVTLALYSYFFAAILARQIIPKEQEPDLYFPFFGVLQFCFYVGWLKVAEVLINPFGEDDDDIELNWLIDRHIKASYMIVDEMHEEHPELLKDQYWDQVVPEDLPYTVASEHYRKYEPKGSAETYKVKEADQLYANIITNNKRPPNDDVYADYESVDTPMVERRKNNWFSRQITKMGSMRSSSAYSSGGLFKRNRHNSVYSSPIPEAVLPGQMLQQPAQKISLYEKFVGRRSIRTQRQLNKQNSKLSFNGSVASQQKNRPRIPTPDVTKEGIEKENRFNLTPIGTTVSPATNIAAGVALATRKLATEPSIYPTNIDDKHPFGTLILSPIKESDSSVNNTLMPNSPSTTELARTVLPNTLQPGAFTTITTTTAITSSPSMTRIITVLPTTHAITTGAQQPTHEVSVAITTIPVTPTPSTNVVITEISDSNDEEMDFGGIMMSNGGDTKLSRHNSTASAVELFSGGSSGSGSSIHNLKSKKTPNMLAVSSAPSTLVKQKPEAKTGEVYV